MTLVKWLDANLEEVLLVLMLIAMTLVMGAQIVMRYVFIDPLTWSEEVSRFLFIWSGFLSISYCFKRGISIQIEQVVALASPLGFAIFKVLETTILLVFYIWMVPFAYTYVMNTISSGQLSPATQIPMYIIYVAPLIGFALAVIRLVQQLVMTIQDVGAARAGKAVHHADVLPADAIPTPSN